MSGFGPNDRLSAVALMDEDRRARPPEIQQELDIALYDLAEENRLRLSAESAPMGPWRLEIALAERTIRLRFAAQDGAHDAAIPLSPLRGLIKDYFEVCESYFDAVKHLPPSEIERVDIGRRAIHDEGSQILRDRLSGHVETDMPTARRLFTVVCALCAKG